MAKLNLIFLFSLLVLTSSAQATEPRVIVKPPSPAEAPAEGPVDLESILAADAPMESLFDTLGPKFDDNGPLSTEARSDQGLMQLACFKQLVDVGGSEDCLLDVVSVLSPNASKVSGMVPLPDKTCCKAFVTLDHQAPECWGFLVSGVVVVERLTKMKEACIAILDM